MVLYYSTKSKKCYGSERGAALADKEIRTAEEQREMEQDEKIAIELMQFESCREQYMKEIFKLRESYKPKFQEHLRNLSSIM